MFWIHTLYRARLSQHGLCLIMLPVVEAFAVFAWLVVIGADDVVVVDVFAATAVVIVVVDAGGPGVMLVVVVVVLARPRFFNDPMDPFNKSGFSTSGPPNSCNCCNQQHSIASIPSST